MDLPAYSFTKYTLPLLFALTSFWSACAGQEAGESRAFLVQSNTVDIEEISDRLIAEISSQLQQSHALEEGYPIFGHIELEPHPTNPGVYTEHCAPDHALLPLDADCISLNRQGDFIGAQIVAQPRAAIYSHMYRVYLALNNPFVRVDPDTNFVAFRVHIRDDETLAQLVDKSIREAVKRIGARRFSH